MLGFEGEQLKQLTQSLLFNSNGYPIAYQEQWMLMFFALLARESIYDLNTLEARNCNQQKSCLVVDKTD
jgi:hypothetical protein